MGISSEAPVDAPAPVAERSRIITIDILRGFAILGLPLIHVNLSFAFSMDSIMTWRWQGDALGDSLVMLGVRLLAHMKMMAVFTLLFGVGLSLQDRSARQAGRPFAGRYLWRLSLLLVIGLLHGVFLWYGDILSLYAFCGVFVMLCRNLRVRTLLILAGVLVVVPLFAVIGFSAFEWNEPLETQTLSAARDQLESGLDKSREHPEDPSSAVSPPETDPSPAGEVRGPITSVDIEEATLKAMTFLADEERIYREGGFWEIVAHRTIIYLLIGGTVTLTLMLWRSLALMLVGMCFLRIGVFDDPAGHRPLLLRTVIYGFALGIPIELAGEVIHLRYGHWVWGNAFSDSLHHIGSLGHGLAYAAGLILLCQTPKWLNLLKPLAAVGRTALTNYLGQSLIAGLIFYSYGLGLFGRVSHVQASLIAIGMMVGQLIISNLWMRYFRFGPIEWLWRSGTYLRVQPLLRGA